MKICFLARPSFDVYSTELFKRLKVKDSSLQGVFVTTNQRESDFVHNALKGVGDYCVFETATFLRENWENFNLDKLTAIEEKYDCKPIWSYIYTDRFLVNREYDYVVKIASGLFSFFEYVYEKTQPDFYYSECIATLQCYAAYIVGKKLGVTYLTQMCARGNLDSTYHYFVMDAYQDNADLERNYLEVHYTDEEIANADKYLTAFEEQNSPPPAMQLVRTRPKIDKQFILAPLRYIKGKMMPENNDKYSYMYYESYKNCLNPIIFYFRYKKLRKYCKQPDYSKKYIYFPLHFQPEASTCVCAQKYEKQLYYIDSFAKSLPADTCLFVKEHYTLLGHKDLSFYKEISKYPNVFLIDPWVSSRELILNSIAVTTLTGTAGLEAILLGKTVYLGGNAPFDTAPGIIKVDDIYLNYDERLNEEKKPNRDDMLKYLCACFRSYHKGNIYCQNYHHLLADNIDDIVASLFEKCESLIEQKR